jgi:hypothetical protein
MGKYKQNKRWARKKKKKKTQKGTRLGGLIKIT